MRLQFHELRLLLCNQFYDNFFTWRTVFAFDEVERKPNFDLWLFEGWFSCARLYAEIIYIPVRTPKWPPRLNFAGVCHGQEAGTVTKPCNEFASLWAAYLSASLRLIFGVSLCLFGTLPLYLYLFAVELWNWVSTIFNIAFLCFCLWNSYYYYTVVNALITRNFLLKFLVSNVTINASHV